MKISELKNAPQWLIDADTLNADVVWNGDIIQWRGGVWRGGEWRDGVWRDGVWRDGEWCGGEWRDGEWCGGEWRDGVWCGGVWCGGVWRGGVWRGGEWRDGVWCGEKLTQPLIFLSGLKWVIQISDTRMQIGCELHAFADWAGFDDARIVKMDRGALKFWRANKAALLALCEARP